MNPVGAGVENVLLTVIVQLIVIIASARIFGALFRRFGQPQVCGEIAAGLILGPSLLGGLFPGAFHFVFNPAVGPIFSVMSQLGLVLLMFLIGLEFDFGHLGANRKIAVSVSGTGILLPFGLGFTLGHFMHGWLALPGTWINFALFMGTAMSITAIPILGRIMIEMGINRTRIGSLTISSAAIDDAAGWILLALVTAIVKSEFDPAKLGWMIAQVLAFAAFMTFVARPLLLRWIRSLTLADLSLNALAILLIVVFLAAVATNLIGIFSIFGAFFLGAILYDQHEFVEKVKRRLSDFVTVFFLPIFFTYTGLRTDIGSMGAGGALWGMCALVLAAAVIGKFGGCTLAARANGVPWRESSIIGVMMNTRALMELIVINIGYDLGVIPKSVFFMLVLMAVVTTYVTSPVLRRLIPGSEMEADYAKSGFSRLRALTS
jgi:Kef-type K+ transport system membrane component KefB